MLPLLPLAARAQAPANDNPSGAIALPLGATCTPLSTTNTGATTTAVTGLGYTNPGCGIAASPKDVWYTFTTAASGQQGSTAVTITVSGTPAGQVRVFSSTGGAAGPFVTVGCAAGTTNNTQAPALALRGLTPATTYYVDVSGYGSADTQGAFTICATTLVLPANDVAVSGIYSLGQVALAYNSPQVARAVVTNLSLGALTNVPVTLTVSGATTFTSTQTVASLAPNASATVTFPGYTLAATGVNTLTVTVPTDDVTSNNSQVFTQNVTANRLAFVDGTQPLNATGVGIGAAGGILAAKYNLATAGTIASITPSFVGAGAGATTYQVQLYDATGTGGTPGTLLYTSPTQTRPTATGSPVVSVPNIPIAAGDFYVAIKELDLNVGLGYQVEDPLRPTTFYFQVPAGAWTAVNTTTLRTRLALEVSVVPAPACAAVQNLTTTGVTTTAANVTFTPITGATYTVTYQAGTGAVQTVTPTPSASPVALSGLTPNTTYTVTVVTNCTGGTTSAAVTTTFTTGSTAPANDECTTATALTVGTTCTNTLATNVGATASTGAPAPGANCFLATTPISNDVWYTVVVPASGNLTVTTSTATGTSVTDTGLLVYSGTCGNLTEVGCSDDISGTNFFSSAVMTGLTPGATLYVRVWSFGTTPTGQFNICATNPAVVANDNPTGAVTLTLGTTCTPTSSTNVGATTTAPSGYTNPGCGVAVSPIDVWFKFTTAATGVGSTDASIQVTGAPAGQVRVFSAASAAGPFTQVGCAAGTTNNTVAGPVRLTGLTPNTTYYIAVSGYGSADTQGAFTICAVGLAAPAAPSYATLPYSESFENTWISVVNTNEAPNNSWRNTPTSGNNSWRREDDGASASWTSPTSGAVTPSATLGTHAARFHSYYAPNNALGNLDLYVNMSTSTNAKVLNFDYVNLTGTDSLKIFVSTNGGTTFTAAPVRQLGVSATFAPVQGITIASTSATTVIRFQGKSDFGDDDIYIDNLRLSVVTAAQNAALAANVNLYPNPAHQSFQLSVPAGMRNASAQLINALGQVVQTRQLSLPAAGGTTSFNVSGLAAGVYSLQLQSGADLVVKRVVVE
ncbi:hypothetical protein GCM10027345_23320 [Hymenobacter daeguensis]